ncbi:hypothetical protein APSETT445_003061 [Aspergillus pseudonomiae]
MRRSTTRESGAMTAIQDAPTKVISPSKLSHVVFRTRPENAAKMAEFWEFFVGGKKVFQSDLLTLIAYDDEHHRIAIVPIPVVGPKHVSFTFNTLQELLLSYRQRKAAGVTPVWCVHHGPTISMYYRDPDGNYIEVQVDVFETGEEAVAYMSGEEYQANPLGVDYDPEEIIAALEKGEDPKKFLRRPGGREPRSFDTVPLLD